MRGEEQGISEGATYVYMTTSERCLVKLANVHRRKPHNSHVQSPDCMSEISDESNGGLITHISLFKSPKSSTLKSASGTQDTCRTGRKL